MTIVDAHLDLSYNAVRGRAVERPAKEQTPDPDDIPTVGLPDLRAGGVALICATIFCLPAATPKEDGYRNGDEAHAMALAQLAWYQARQADGSMRFIRGASELSEDALARTDTTHAILLLEGADALRSAGDVQNLFDAGMRIVGLSWRGTRHAGGTGMPGPLTAEGIALLTMLDRLGIIHDASHLAEESFWQLLALSAGSVIASHSNCRAIVPTDRQLSDEMILAIAQRGGVVGINFFDKFLLPPEEYGNRRATLADVIRHIQHICQLTGSAAHAAIGTDMDGGLGRDQIPREIHTAADLHKVGDALSEAGFSDADVAAIMGRNWIEFFRRTLPA